MPEADADLALIFRDRSPATVAGRRLLLPVVLLVGLAAAVALRVALGGADVARSIPAGLVFAAVLLLLAALLRTSSATDPLSRATDLLSSATDRSSGATSRPSKATDRASGAIAGPLATEQRGSRGRLLAARVLVGLGGAAVLCLPAGVHAGVVPVSAPGTHGFLPWAAAVAVVATAEEVFLRGVLYRLLLPAGHLAAIGVTAIAFAALHIPLYGWGAFPLDFAVGVWLGALRAVTGAVLPAAVAHVVADWAGWFLV